MSNTISPVLEGVQTTSRGEVDEDLVIEVFNSNLNNNVLDLSKGTITKVYFSNLV